MCFGFTSSTYWNLCHLLLPYNTKFSINFELYKHYNCDQILEETGTKSNMNREALCYISFY